MAKAKVVLPEKITPQKSAEAYLSYAAILEALDEVIGDTPGDSNVALALYDPDEPVARDQYGELLIEDMALLRKTMARIGEKHLKRFGGELPSLDAEPAEEPAEESSDEVVAEVAEDATAESESEVAVEA